MTVKMDNAQDGCQSEYSRCCRDCTGCLEPWTRYKLPYNCSSITHYNDATIQTNSSSPIECDLGAPMLTDLSSYDADLLKVRAHCIHDYLDSLHFVNLFILCLENVLYFFKKKQETETQKGFPLRFSRSIMSMWRH